jgi:hypothetical protein
MSEIDRIRKKFWRGHWVITRGKLARQVIKVPFCRVPSGIGRSRWDLTAYSSWPGRSLTAPLVAPRGQASFAILPVVALLDLLRIRSRGDDIRAWAEPQLKTETRKMRDDGLTEENSRTVKPSPWCRRRVPRTGQERRLTPRTSRRRPPPVHRPTPEPCRPRRKSSNRGWRHGNAAEWGEWGRQRARDLGLVNAAAQVKWDEWMRRRRWNGVSRFAWSRTFWPVGSVGIARLRSASSALETSPFTHRRFVLWTSSFRVNWGCFVTRHVASGDEAAKPSWY